MFMMQTPAQAARLSDTDEGIESQRAAPRRRSSSFLGDGRRGSLSEVFMRRWDMQSNSATQKSCPLDCFSCLHAPFLRPLSQAGISWTTAGGSVCLPKSVVCLPCLQLHGNHVLGQAGPLAAMFAFAGVLGSILSGMAG